MNKRGRQDPRTAMVIMILVIMWIAISINIAFININRALFWIDFILGVLFIIAIVFFIYKGITERNFYAGVDSQMCFTMAGMFTVILITSYFLLGMFYDAGYSNEALVDLIELHEQKDEIEVMLDIVAFKGKKLTRSAIDEAYYEICKDPNMPCEARQPYKKVLNLYGNKDSADAIVEFLRIR